MREFYLGIDSGQSCTEAVIADREGNILGRGFSVSSSGKENERDKLTRTILESIDGAMKTVEMPPMTIVQFAAAHCAVPGDVELKKEIISPLIKTTHFSVGQDAPSALYGATGGKEGIVVIADAGSVAYGENANGKNAKVGGWGHLFSDEGSCFWIGTQAVRRALKEEDGLAGPTVLTGKLLSFFACSNLNELILKVYSNEITRDALSSFTEQVHQAAAHGDKVAMQIIESGARQLALLAVVTATKLEFTERIPVAIVGEVFKGKLTRVFFKAALNESLPAAKLIAPRFSIAIGALMFAYRQTGIELTEGSLHHLEATSMVGCK